MGFDNGGPISAYIEGRNLTNKAYIQRVHFERQHHQSSDRHLTIV
jgi:hypothetical protein